MYNLEQLAPYLPYKLKGIWKLSDVINLRENQKDELREKVLDIENPEFFLNYCKPILRPLYDLLDTNTARELNSISSFVFVYDLRYKTISIQTDDKCDIELADMISAMNILYGNHFDVFGLIDKGLAIDINTLPCKS